MSEGRKKEEPKKPGRGRVSEDEADAEVTLRRLRKNKGRSVPLGDVLKQFGIKPGKRNGPEQG